MANYICLSTGFFNHRKTLRLEKKIGERAFWVPPKLWAYAAVNQPDGDFSKYTATDWEPIIGLPELRAVQCITAMKDIGFFDPDMKLHSWEEWNAFHQRRQLSARNAAKARWSRGGEGTSPAPQERDDSSTIPLPCPERRDGEPPPERGEGEGPHPKEKEPQVASKNHPDQGTIKRQQGSSEKKNTGFKPDVKAKNEGFKTRLDLKRKLDSLKELERDHIAHPESRYNFKTPELKASARADYRKIVTQIEQTNRLIAGLET